ncbi:MAG: hypothetical protein AB7H66_00390 [Hyphomonadaceae bacterium]
MGRPHATRLRESRTPAPRGAKVIDATFQVIGKRTIWDRVVLALTAVFWAAVIGFAIPQLWLISQRVGAYFNGG